MLTKALTIADIQALIADDWQALNAKVEQNLDSGISLIKDLCQHILSSGGKRLRPLMTLLCAKAVNYQGDAHIALAAIIELIHTATLLHDDVVDEAEKRRGKRSANAIWGNQAAILVGDYLYSRAFEMVVNIDHMPILQVLSKATNTMAEGEVMQLLNCNDPSTSEAEYLQVIAAKTATLFSAASGSAAILAEQTDDTRQALYDYGQNIGIAFQLVDDSLDFQADETKLGKPLCADLAEGKPTLPLIYALQHASPAEQTLIRASIRQGETDNIEPILAAIASTDAIAYTVQVAQRYVDQALTAIQTLPASPYQQALADLALFAVGRDH